MYHSRIYIMRKHVLIVSYLYTFYCPTKAFDRVKHGELFKMLKNIQIDEKDHRLLYNLYQQQTETVRLPGGMTPEFEKREGSQARLCGISGPLQPL